MSFRYGSPLKTYSLGEAIRFYPDSAFEKLTCSTIPMLSMMAHKRRLFHSILKETSFSPKDYTAYLEYTVVPKHGRGKASCTDVMLVNGDKSLAIESKWRENMYDTVAKWKEKKGDNADKVLESWLRLLQKHADKPLKNTTKNHIIYQMLHRAASAAEAGREPAVAYFCFKMKSVSQGAGTNEVVQRLTDLWSLLGTPNTFSFYVAEIEIKGTEVYEKLRGAINSTGKKALPDLLIAALQAKAPLFDFSPNKVIRIGQPDTENKL